MTPTSTSSAAGAAIVACPSCSEHNNAGSRFCRHCGHDLAQAKPVIADGNGKILDAKMPESKAPSKLETTIVERAKADAASDGAQAYVASADQLGASSVPLSEKLLPGAPAKDKPRASLFGNTTSPAAAPPVASSQPAPSAAEIDARRAQQLLERALGLSEKGDMAGAILACRQAVALAPTKTAGFSMLGLLLERAGDARNAITAYEKVLQLDPNSSVERESLTRLRDKTSQRNPAAIFHFDDNELFADTAAPTVAVAKPAPVVPDAPIEMVAPRPATITPSLTAATPAPVASEMSKLAADARRVSDRRDNDRRAAPRPTPDRRELDRRAAAAAAASSAAAANLAGAKPIPAARPVPVGAPQIPGVAATSGAASRSSQISRTPVAPLGMAMPGAALTGADIAGAGITAGGVAAPRAGMWQVLVRQPSFYFRGLPLAGAAGLGLLFLAWAHNAASGGETVMAPAQPVPVVMPEVAPTAAPGVLPTPVGPPLGAAAQPMTPKTPARPAIVGVVIDPNRNARKPVVAGRPASAPRLATTSGARPISAGPASSQPVFPAAPRLSASDQSFTPGGAMPAPRVQLPGSGSVAPPIQAVPVSPDNSGASDGAGASSSGTPFNPGNAAGRNVIRVTSPRAATGAAPVRPDNRARADERAAAAAAAAGNNDAALRRMNSAIESGGGDTGYRYQRRGLLYLNSGNYSAAINDFQTAISAYEDQINRGQHVDEARAGERACQSGIQQARLSLGR